MLFPKHENVSAACRFTFLRSRVLAPLCLCALMSSPLCPAHFCLHPSVIDRKVEAQPGFWKEGGVKIIVFENLLVWT